MQPPIPSNSGLTWGRKTFGEFGPFFVNAGPRSFLVVHNPEHIRKILDSPEAVTQSASRREVFDKILGSPQYALDFYTSKNVSETHKQALEQAHVDLTRKHLTGESLSKNVETYASIFSEQQDVPGWIMDTDRGQLVFPPASSDTMHTGVSLWSGHFQAVSWCSQGLLGVCKRG
jgi:hypothetical protein